MNNMIPILISGGLGGLATVTGKIAFSGESSFLRNVVELCRNVDITPDEYCDHAVLIIRIAAFVIMFACNAMVIGFFLKAIESNHTVVVIVVSSATNFLTSGLLGQVLFGELVSSLWCVGSILIVIGMLLVAISQGHNRKE